MNRKYKCAVCRVEEAEGVFASRIAPVSSAYCRSCLEKGAEPYGVLVTHVAHVNMERPDNELHAKLNHVKHVTLDVVNETEQQFASDVAKRIEELSNTYKNG